MKTSKILAIVGVIVVVALAVMWFRSSGGAAPKDAAIITPMPLSDYSIQDTVSGASSNGFPDALPESLPPLPGQEADVMTGAPTTTMPETTSIPAVTTPTTMAPTLPAVQDATTTTEGFMAFAPKNFRGDIL